MSDGPTSDLDHARAQLQLLQSGFVARLPARLDDIRAAADRLVAGGGDRPELDHLHRLVHSLTGSAGTSSARSVGPTNSMLGPLGTSMR